MELRDLVVTPLVVILTYVLAYFIRPRVTDPVVRPYFFPALTLKIVGALAVGFIYQFYYHGGDTYNFHTHGSRHVWEAFMDSPEKGLKILFSDKHDQRGIYAYTSRIPFYRDASSFTIIQLASVFDLFTFSTYSATAICFALIGFTGGWMLFLTFYKTYPHLHRPIAWATLFIPSVFFWGSGLLKDTVTLAFLGIATYSLRQVIVLRKLKFGSLLLTLFSLYAIYAIKKYILLCYLPAALVMVYLYTLGAIRSKILRLLLLPVIMTVVAISGYYAVLQVGKDDPRYQLETLGETAKVTAYDIAYQTGREAGSTYSLGQLDGSFSSMTRLAPQAINVALFRPYLWEVKNPLMLTSALESLVFFLLTIYIVAKSWRYLLPALGNADTFFCLLFSVTFAFAVGISTYNFGTLSRYKIPLLPFYALALTLLYYFPNRARNVSSLDDTEY